MSNKEPTLEELIKARHDAAVLVRRFGEKFLPIFQRLDDEVSAREARQAALKRALEIAEE